MEKKPSVTSAISDHQKIHIINETKSYKKLWIQLTNEEKRLALNEADDDLWHFDEICQGIIEDRKTK